MKPLTEFTPGTIVCPITTGIWDLPNDKTIEYEVVEFRPAGTRPDDAAEDTDRDRIVLLGHPRRAGPEMHRGPDIGFSTQNFKIVRGGQPNY